MGKVDKQALHKALDDSVVLGVLDHWETRPLGMYWLQLPHGQVLRPDAKETPSWTQGALLGAAVARRQASHNPPPPALDREGKTVVMAMLITWQTLNKVANPTNPRYAKRFLVLTPGITIRDRLRVLQPGSGFKEGYSKCI